MVLADVGVGTAHHHRYRGAPVHSHPVPLAVVVIESARRMGLVERALVDWELCCARRYLFDFAATSKINTPTMKKKKHSWAYPKIQEALFTTAALVAFGVFVVDLFTFVLRRHNIYMISIVPMVGVLLGMLAVVREEKPRWAWVAFGVNALYLVVVAFGIAFERLALS